MRMSLIGPPRRRPLFGLRENPGRLAVAFFRLPLNAYRHGAGVVFGHTFLRFTHTGRRTGRTYEAVAMVLRYDATRREAIICAGWGPETDWVRNLRAHAATDVTIARERFPAEARFLDEDEAVGVGVGFRRAHPWRLRLLSAILGWPDLRDDATLREFVRAHPFLALRAAG